MNSEDSTSKDDMLLVLIEEIQRSIKNREWRTAEHKTNRLLDLYPNNSEALMYLGISRAAQGYEPEGENLLLASLTLDPRNKEAYYNLGLIVMNQGRCILAADAFRHGLNLDPTNHALLFQLGCALEKLGKHEEALEVFQRALSHTPSEVELDFTQATHEAIKRIQTRD